MGRVSYHKKNSTANKLAFAAHDIMRNRRVARATSAYNVKGVPLVACLSEIRQLAVDCCAVLSENNVK